LQALDKRFGRYAGLFHPDASDIETQCERILGEAVGKYRSAFQRKLETAILASSAKKTKAAELSNDTDLIEPLRIVTEDVGLPLTLLTPIAKPSPLLVKASTHVRHIEPYLGPCQFPATISIGGKMISKPASW
jgi:hypothetical protein